MNRRLPRHRAPEGQPFDFSVRRCRTHRCSGGNAAGNMTSSLGKRQRASHQRRERLDAGRRLLWKRSTRVRGDAKARHCARLRIHRKQSECAHHQEIGHLPPGLGALKQDIVAIRWETSPGAANTNSLGAGPPRSALASGMANFASDWPLGYAISDSLFLSSRARTRTVAPDICAPNSVESSGAHEMSVGAADGLRPSGPEVFGLLWVE